MLHLSEVRVVSPGVTPLPQTDQASHYDALSGHSKAPGYRCEGVLIRDDGHPDSGSVDRW
jgi:hypothetical protein